MMRGFSLIWIWVAVGARPAIAKTLSLPHATGHSYRSARNGAMQAIKLLKCRCYTQIHDAGHTALTAAAKNRRRRRRESVL
jgi:hypothetical protein